MKNLDQIRARNALRCEREGGNDITGKKGGEVIKKIPPLILNHGLLQTLAYSFGEKERGWQIVFDHVARHLADPDIAVLPAAVDSHQKLMDHLTGEVASSETLKLATAETMAWLSYARRFIRQNDV